MNTIVTAFCRMNPPTVGHLLLLKKLEETAKKTGGDAILFLSQSLDSKKNPLKFEEKVNFVKQICKENNLNVMVSSDPRIKTFLDVPANFSGKYENLIFIGGSDRVADFEKVLNKYNGIPDKSGYILYKFDLIKVVSSGERDPDSDDESGMSGSKARSLVSQGNYETFKRAIPLKDAKPVYDAVRRGMGLEEKVMEIKFNAKIDPIEFAAGMSEEAEEHGWDLAIDTVLAHLKKEPKYYTKLRQAGLLDKRSAAILDIK